MASLRNRKLSGRLGFEPRTGDPWGDDLLGEEAEVGLNEDSDAMSPGVGMFNDMFDEKWLGLLSSC